MTAKRKPNGTREPFLKVIEVAERSIEKLTVLGGQQERLSDALDQTVRSQMELVAHMQQIRSELAATPERTQMAVVDLKQHVTDERQRAVGTVLSEAASLRTAIKWTRRQRIVLGLAVLGVILVAQAAGQLEPLMGAAAKWLGKALGF